MDDHPAPDTIVRDVAIILVVGGLIYITTNVTTINLETVLSGEAPAKILAFFGVDTKLSEVQNFFLSLQSSLTVIAVFFLGGSFWATLKIREIHHHEHEKYKALPIEEVVQKGKSTQWQVILEHVNSDNPAEWKLAILEADNILDEVLEDLGYVGDSVAEKLKSMSRSKISSYDDVWEAHKLRNEIAHGGAIDMDLTNKMAKDAIAKFENAFRDLGYL